MNTIFLVTGATPKHVQFAGQWFANRLANVYPNPEAVGNNIPELPVAVLVEGEVQGAVPLLRKISQAPIVHCHIGATSVRKAQGARQLYHIKASRVVDPKDVQFLMRLEGMWREEKILGRGATSERREPIRVPAG